MVESLPPSAFAVIEADFLFQIREVAFDAPAELGGINKRGDQAVGTECGEPLFHRLVVTFRPCDQKPFLRPGFRTPVIAMRRSAR